MPAAVEFCESNQVGEVVTHNIAHSNFGNFDAANLDAPTHAIVPGARSVAKYQRLHVTNMNTSSQIDDIRIWQTGALAGASTHPSNLRTASYVQIPYATPTDQAITNVDQAIPTALPPSANLGIGGSLTGLLNAIGYSDYFVHCILTGNSDANGANASFNIQYGEVL